MLVGVLPDARPWVAPALAALVLVPLACAFALAVRQRRRLRSVTARGLLIVATLLFALSAAAVALLFGGQAGLAMLVLGGSVDSGAVPALVALLFGLVAAAITVSVLAGPLQSGLDRLALPAAVRRQRAELRGVAEALPRRRGDAEPGGLAGIEEAEFTRLTRNALRNYGDLAKLVASPLTGLATVEQRLAARRAPDQPLERAAELKAVLGEAIQELRPRGDADFGTTDEWRYYNALHYPYVLGVRPYRQPSARAGRNTLPPDARRAFDYLATQVPERTLHNWQNAAARLVAAELRRRERELAVSGSARSGRGSNP